MPRPKYKYVISAPGGPFAFVPHPHLVALWVRAHPCVLTTGCSDCRAAAGDLCVNRDGTAMLSSTHWTRRRGARADVAELLREVDTTIVSKRGVRR